MELTYIGNANRRGSLGCRHCVLGDGGVVEPKLDEEIKDPSG